MFFKKLSTTAVAVMVVVGPMFLELAGALRLRAQSSSSTAMSSPSFDVASVKPSHSGGLILRVTPDGFSGHLPVKILIMYAYNVMNFQISGGTGWIDSERYDIEAKIDEATISALKKLPWEEESDQRRRMMQSLLAERFKLKVSHSSKELPIYALVVAKNGPKLTKSAASPAVSGNRDPNHTMSIRSGEITATRIPMSEFAEQLARHVGRNVVDKTGLEGIYDFTLHWTPEPQGLAAGPPDSQLPAAPLDSSGPSIFIALQEQLGLKLESQKGPVETLIIESVERPSEN